MGKGLGLLLIAVASGLMIYWLVVPVVLPSPSASRAQPAQAQVSSSDAQPQPAVSPSSPALENRTQAPVVAHDSSLPPPRTPEQRASDDLEAKRAPYYQWVRNQARDRVSDVRPADDDGATLLIYTTFDTPDVVPTVVRDVVAPAANKYGFRHVRFFVPNPTGSVAQYRFDAESNSDRDGSWHTFHK